MSSLDVRRLIASVAALALAGVGMAATAAPASAAYVSTNPPSYNNGTTADPQSIGHIKFLDASGNQIIGGSLTNLGGAVYAVSDQTPRTGATKATLSVAAPDHTKVSSLWASQIISGSTNFPVAAGGSVPTSVSGATGPVATLVTGDGNLASFLGVAALDTTTGYQGYLQLRIKDSGPGVAAATTWATTEIAFDSGAGTWTQVFPVVSVVTTAISAPTFSPVSPVASGTSVTLSSTVTPANSTGSVHFFDGATDLGAATYNATTGVATLTLPSGFTNATGADVAHSITAAFTPAGLFGSSTSSTSSLTVQRVPAIATTTNMTLSQSTVTLGSADVLTATAVVTPASGAAVSGTVNFYVDGSSTANATKALVPGDNGSTGAVTINLWGLTGSSSPGTAHTIVATFTDGTTWSGSSSSAATVNVTAGPMGDPQNIQTSIAAGTLDLSTALTISTPLLLPSMTLSTSADEYFSSLLITGLSMTDTRPGNLPYTLSLISTNLNKLGVANPNPNESISGQNVGFNVTSLVSTNATPNTFLGSQNPGASTAGQNFTGFNNAAAAHVQITDTGSQGLGGSTPHPILHANQGTGTTVVAATMTIRAPTNLLDGTYAGTVTFSVLGS